MASWLLALAALALLLPAAQAQTGLGLGGLAPQAAPGPQAATANIAVPTNLCKREFCLQAAPAACGGDCILTALGNTSTVRAATYPGCKQIAAEVQACRHLLHRPTCRPVAEDFQMLIATTHCPSALAGRQLSIQRRA